MLVGILIAGNSIEGKEGGADYFAGDKVWLYATILTVGYMVSRGLAKAGIREPYFDGGTNEQRDRQRHLSGRGVRLGTSPRSLCVGDPHAGQPHRAVGSIPTGAKPRAGRGGSVALLQT